MELTNDQIALLFALGDVALMAFIIWSHVTKQDRVVRVLAKWILFVSLFGAGNMVDIPDTSNVTAAVMTMSCVQLVTLIFLFIVSMPGFSMGRHQN